MGIMQKLIRCMRYDYTSRSWSAIGETHVAIIINHNDGSDTLGWTEKLRASRIITTYKERIYYAKKKTYSYRRVQETSGSTI